MGTAGNLLCTMPINIQGTYETVQSVDGATWYKQYAENTVSKIPYDAGDGKIAYNESIVQKLPPTPPRKDRI